VLNGPFIRLREVTKSYGGLRPLRVEDLAVARGEAAVLQGMDESAAAVLVDLVTGTTLPDSGEVAVAGVSTASLDNQASWLAFLEQFGLVNPRVVLLDELTVLQNLAVPLTLDLDPLPKPFRERARELAAMVGLPETLLDTPLAGASPLARFRVRLGRAVAHRPAALLLEHPTLGLAPGDVGFVAQALTSVSREEDRAVLVVTNDDDLGTRLESRRLTWSAASGRVSERRRWFGWIGR
jgi:predicted ABC-type transport system involved in lysophospholipase L1 biosynthesis ATPase subunit